MNVRWIALKKKSCTHCDLSFFRIFQSHHEKIAPAGNLPAEVTPSKRTDNTPFQPKKYQVSEKEWLKQLGPGDFTSRTRLC
jgi:hypothetical protein